MSEFYDALETRPPEQRETALMTALATQVAAAQATPAMATLLAGVDARAVNSRAALAALPVTRKAELLERQKTARAAGGDPFGGFAHIGWRSQGAVAMRSSPGWRRSCGRLPTGTWHRPPRCLSLTR